MKKKKKSKTLVLSQKHGNQKRVEDIDKNNKKLHDDMDKSLSDHIVGSTKYYFNKIFGIKSFAYTFRDNKYFNWDKVFGKKKKKR